MCLWLQSKYKYTIIRKNILPYFVYILSCVDGTLYTGIATDVVRRFVEHKEGKGAKYTRAHKPSKVVYQEKVGTRSEAQKREAEIKKLSRIKKLAMIRECASQAFWVRSLCASPLLDQT